MKVNRFPSEPPGSRLAQVERDLTGMEIDREISGKQVHRLIGQAPDLTTCSDLRPGDLFYCTEFELDGQFAYCLRVDRDVPNDSPFGQYDSRYVFCRVTCLVRGRIEERVVPEGKEAFVPWR